MKKTDFHLLVLFCFCICFFVQPITAADGWGVTISCKECAERRDCPPPQFYTPQGACKERCPAEANMQYNQNSMSMNRYAPCDCTVEGQELISSSDKLSWKCQCPAGQSVSSDGKGCECPEAQSKSSDGKTCECPAGQIKSSDGMECEACPVGQSVSSDGKRCECPTGHIKSSDSMECEECPAGHIVSADGKKCVNCPVSQIVSSDGTKCERCPVGQTVSPDRTRCLSDDDANEQEYL